jgi:DEAD/DEAH box helicase
VRTKIKCDNANSMKNKASRSSSSSSSSSSDDDSTDEQLQRMDEKLQRRRQQEEQRDDNSSTTGDMDSLGSEVYKAIDESVKGHYNDMPSSSDASGAVNMPDQSPAVVKVEKKANNEEESPSPPIETHERRYNAESTVATLTRDSSFDSFEPSVEIERPRHCQQQGGRNDGNLRTDANRAPQELDSSSESSSPSSSLASTPPESSKAHRLEQPCRSRDGAPTATGSTNHFLKGTSQRIANPYKTGTTPTNTRATINPYQSSCSKSKTSTPMTPASTRTTSYVDSLSPLLTPQPPTPRGKSPPLLTPYPPTPKLPKASDPLTNRVIVSATIRPPTSRTMFEEKSSTNEPSCREPVVTEGRKDKTLTARDFVDLGNGGLRSSNDTDKPSKSNLEEDDVPTLFFDDEESDSDADVAPNECKYDKAEPARSKFLFRRVDESTLVKQATNKKPQRTTEGQPSQGNRCNNTQDLDQPLPWDDPTTAVEKTNAGEETIVDFAAKNVARIREVDPSLYIPPPFVPQQDPIVHSFSLRNRPLNKRQQIPVDQIFSPPISHFWKSKFKTFNHLQSEVVDVLAHSNDNFLISSPTGSGKSTIFEIAMATLIQHDLLSQPKSTRQAPLFSKHRKMVYVAPSKALCEERYTDWSRRFAELKLGIEVAMITGDAEPGEAFRDLASAHFIVTTPEKFDSLSRRWTENFYLFAAIKLLMVDEVHLVGDPSRGWCLETIICRMKTIQRAASNVVVDREDLLSSR